MLMQTINLLASARPNLGGQGAGSVSTGGGGTTGDVGEDNCAGRGDDAQNGRRQGEEEDGMAAAEPRTPGRTTRRRRTARRRWRPGGRGGRGRLGRKPPAFRGPTAADRRHGGGRGCRRISGGRRRRRIPWGRGRGAPRKRRSGRMTMAAEEEDTTMTAAGRGRKSG
jgi:hypothetical protein